MNQSLVNFQIQLQIGEKLIMAWIYKVFVLIKNAQLLTRKFGSTKNLESLIWIWKSIVPHVRFVKNYAQMLRIWDYTRQNVWAEEELKGRKMRRICNHNKQIKINSSHLKKMIKHDWNGFIWKWMSLHCDCHLDCKIIRITII